MRKYEKAAVGQFHDVLQGFLSTQKLAFQDLTPFTPIYTRDR